MLPSVVSSQNIHLLSEQVELGNVETTASAIRILPHVECLEDCAQRVDLELVVAVFAGDEDGL